MRTRTSATLLCVLALQVEWCSAMGCCEGFCASFPHNETLCTSADGLSACPNKILSTGQCSCAWISISDVVDNYACLPRITIEEQRKMDVTPVLIAALASVGGCVCCSLICYNFVMCCGYEDNEEDEEEDRQPGETDEDYGFRRSASEFRRATSSGVPSKSPVPKSRKQMMRKGLRRISSVVIGGRTDSLAALTQKTVQNSKTLSFMASVGRSGSTAKGPVDLDNLPQGQGEGFSPVKPEDVSYQGSANKQVQGDNSRYLGDERPREIQRKASLLADTAKLIGVEATIGHLGGVAKDQPSREYHIASSNEFR